MITISRPARTGMYGLRRPLLEPSLASKRTLANQGASALRPDVIYPTGQCFDDIGDLIIDLDPAQRAHLVAVHGTVMVDGEECAHAWAEIYGQVIEGAFYRGDLVFVVWPDAAEWRRSHLASRCMVYGHTRYMGLFKQSGHTGPWTRQLRLRCAEALDASTKDVAAAG